MQPQLATPAAIDRLKSFLGGRFPSPVRNVQRKTRAICADQWRGAVACNVTRIPDLNSSGTHPVPRTNAIARSIWLQSANSSRGELRPIAVVR